MEPGSGNGASNCLDEMVRLFNSDRVDVLIHGILMTICYAPLKFGLFYDQRAESTTEKGLEYWEKEHKWLDSVVPNFLKAAYSGDPEHLKGTGWVGLGCVK